MTAPDQPTASLTRRAPLAASPIAISRLVRSGLLAPEEERALAEAVMPARMLRAGTDLVREGERADALFLVTHGWLGRYTITQDGGRHFSALLVPGDIGNLDTLMLERLDYGVRTLTKATVLALPRDRALALTEQHAGIARAFTWLAMVENVTLSRWTLSLGRRPALERVAHLLCELSVRLRVEADGASSFVLPLTQEQIADAVGLTAVHVNRMMQQLRHDGLIRTDGRKFTMPDVAQLRRVAGFDPRYLHLDASANAQAAPPAQPMTDRSA